MRRSAPRRTRTRASRARRARAASCCTRDKTALCIRARPCPPPVARAVKVLADGGLFNSDHLLGVAEGLDLFTARPSTQVVRAARTSPARRVLVLHTHATTDGGRRSSRYARDA